MDLIYKHEKTLFGILLALSLLIWAALLVGTLGMVLLYLALCLLGYGLARSALVSYLRGTAVQITPHQFPDLHHRLTICCQRLGLAQPPQAYLLQMGGVLHAFATRFFGRDFIVLYSEVVDALEERPDAINFYIGHELGHLKRNHLRWAALLAPAAWLPLLGSAYARAREYTCDRHGFHACDELHSAQLGLAALAAGGKRWRQLGVSHYSAQAQHSGGFWMSFHELVGDRPWLVKRMAAVRALAHGNEVSPPARHGLAYLAALCVPRLGLGGAGSVLGLLALAGLLAALALPAYGDYTARLKMAQAVAVGHEATAAVERYIQANGQAPATLEAAGFRLDDPNHAVQAVTVDGGNGVVRVFPADLHYRGQAIAFMPRLDENKQVRWRCASAEIPARVLPPECRP